MSLSIRLSKKALANGDSPFGCILVNFEGDVLTEGLNTTNTDQNPIAHAEINAIEKLCEIRKSKKLDGVVLVSSVQSCPMCFSAAYRSGIRHFVYGCAEDDTLVPKIDVHGLNSACTPKAEIITGVSEDQ